MLGSHIYHKNLLSALQIFTLLYFVILKVTLDLNLSVPDYERIKDATGKQPL